MTIWHTAIYTKFHFFYPNALSIKILNSFQWWFVKYTSFSSFDITLNSKLWTFENIIYLSCECLLHTHAKCCSSSITFVLQIKQSRSSGFRFLNLPVSICNGRIPSRNCASNDLLFLKEQYWTYFSVIILLLL